MTKLFANSGDPDQTPHSLRVDPFSEADWCAGKQTEVTKIVSIVKWAENLLSISSA